jgi:hypothetical protein
MEVMSMSLGAGKAALQFPSYACEEVKYSTLDWPAGHRVSADHVR